MENKRGMIKTTGRNAGGEKVVKIKMTLLLTKRAMIGRLCDVAHRQNGKEYFNNLSKSKAFKDLKSQLFFHGIFGENDHFDQGDIVDELNEIEPTAKDWVEKNYGHLYK